MPLLMAQLASLERSAPGKMYLRSQTDLQKDLNIVPFLPACEVEHASPLPCIWSVLILEEASI